MGEGSVVVGEDRKNEEEKVIAAQNSCEAKKRVRGEKKKAIG